MIPPVIPCWVVHDGDDIVGVYRSRRTAAKYGQPYRFVLVRGALWQSVLQFTLRWLGYRDTGIRPQLEQIHWSDVSDAEEHVRGTLAVVGFDQEPIAPLPPPLQSPPPADPVERDRQLDEAFQQLAAAQRELEAMRIAQIHAKRTEYTLRQEIAELEQQQREAKTAAVIDITGTLAYRNASQNAPTDPVHAYRAGMVYAAQVFNQART